MQTSKQRSAFLNRHIKREKSFIKVKKRVFTDKYAGTPMQLCNLVNFPARTLHCLIEEYVLITTAKLIDFLLLLARKEDCVRERTAFKDPGSSKAAH